MKQEYNSITIEHLRLLRERLHQDNYYLRFEELARYSAYHNVYLVGGFLYRTLAEIIHSGDYNPGGSDYDFISQKGFYVANNSFSSFPNIRIVKTRGSFDFLLEDVVPLQKDVALSCDARIINAPKSIRIAYNEKEADLFLPGNQFYKDDQQMLKEYFLSVPLNIQAVAYNVTKHSLVLSEGLNAIFQKKIAINNSKNALESAKVRDLDDELDYLLLKAEALPGFDVIV